MKAIIFLLSALGALIVAGPAQGAPVRDCPLAHDPLSIDAPLLDVQLHPQGPATLETAAPGLVRSFTEKFGGVDLPPGFAAILSPRLLLEDYSGGKALAPAVDEKLKALPIDDAFVLARCARYDDDRPVLPGADGRPAVLVFEKINGFRDEPSLAAAREALSAIARARGWQIVFTERGGVMNPTDLARFAAVVWNNVSGDALTAPQRAAFRNYIEGGGGYVGIHGAGGDPRFFWDWYADTLVGARFIGHPASPQFQTTTVQIVDRRSTIGAGVSRQWPLLEEWYSFDRNPAEGGAVVVATIDEKAYSPLGFGGQKLAMGTHPIAWRKFVGDGRSFYTAIGHRPENYRNADVARLLANGIAWAMGGEKR